MATFLNRLTALCGTPAIGTETNTWLTDGAVDVIRRIGLIDPGQLYKFAAEITVGTSGISLDPYVGGKALTVYNATRESMEIPPEMRYRAGESDSLFRATTKHPKHYYLNGTLFVLPASSTAKASAIAIPTVTGAATGISPFPDSLEHAVALYAAAKWEEAQMYDAIAGLPSDPTLATPPTISWTMTATLTAAAATEIGAISIPSFSFPATPTITDLDLSALATPSPIPSAPSFTAISIGLATAPTYTKPTQTFVATPTISDLSITATVPAVLTAPSFTTPSITLATAPTYTKPTPPYSFTTGFALLGTYIDTSSEDLERAVAKIQEMQADTQAYVAEINNELSEFNKEAEIYQRTLEKEIAEVRAVLDEEGGEYTSKVSRHTTEVQHYANRVNEQVQEFNANVAKDIGLWSPQLQTQMAEYQADIQNELNEFNKEVAIYTTTLQKNIAQAQTLLGQENQEYMASLQRYSAHLSKYQLTMTTKVQEYTVNEVQKELGIWTSELGNEVARFQGLAAATLDLHKARITSRSSLNEREVARYAAQLQLVSSVNTVEIQEYTTRVDAVIKEFTAQLQERQQAYTYHLKQHENLRRDYEQVFIPFQQQSERGQIIHNPIV